MDAMEEDDKREWPGSVGEVERDVASPAERRAAEGEPVASGRQRDVRVGHAYNEHMKYAIAIALVLAQEPGFGAQDDPTYTVRFQVGGTS